MERTQAADREIGPIVKLCVARQVDVESLSDAQLSSIVDFVIKDGILWKTLVHNGRVFERLVVPRFWRRPLMRPFEFCESLC